MIRPTTLRVAALLSALAAGPLSAQVAQGDSAWVAGDFHTARIAYERALAADSLSVRANYRLAVLASWDGKLDSALTLLARARRAEPDDPDVRYYQGRVLSWQGKHRQAIARFDSLLAEHPGHREAALARAETLSWAGRLDQADSSYRALAIRYPDDPDARAGRARIEAWRGHLTSAAEAYEAILARRGDHVASLAGLAQVRLWQGRLSEADQLAESALILDPARRDALDVQRAVAAARRANVEFELGWSHDSDDNTNWWQLANTSIALSDRVRAFTGLGVMEATDPARDAERLSAEAGATGTLGPVQATAAAGVRRLLPDGAAKRTLPTFRSSASWRVSPLLGIGVGWAHYSFDETAFLIGRDLDVDAIDASLDLTPRRGISVASGIGYGWLSDENRRQSAVLSIGQALPHGFTVGVFGRVLKYDFRGIGYFSPDRFLLGEVRGSWSWGSAKWYVRAGGGLGAQQITEAGDAQSEWHLEGRLARRWGTVNEVALSGLTSNNAASSTTGAFRYSTATFSVRLGL